MVGSTTPSATSARATGSIRSSVVQKPLNPASTATLRPAPKKGQTGSDELEVEQIQGVGVLAQALRREARGGARRAEVKHRRGPREPGVHRELGADTMEALCCFGRSPVVLAHRGDAHLVIEAVRVARAQPLQHPPLALHAGPSVDRRLVPFVPDPSRGATDGQTIGYRTGVDRELVTDLAAGAEQAPLPEALDSEEPTRPVVHCRLHEQLKDVRRWIGNEHRPTRPPPVRRSSASSVSVHVPVARGSTWLRAHAKSSRHGIPMTRAPSSRARSAVPSVLPVSATTNSSTSGAAASKHARRFAASFRTIIAALTRTSFTGPTVGQEKRVKSSTWSSRQPVVRTGRPHTGAGEAQ